MREFSERYPVWLCDVWGVVHDGVRPNTDATAALARHRREGGTVILITNSPRTGPGVEAQLTELGVDWQSHDATVTSGDVTRTLMLSHGGGKVYHVGHERSASIFAGLEVARVPLAEAKAVLCTGLFDDVNDRLEDYDRLLGEMKGLGLTMICANPDRIVRKGERILYCAGALAERYQALGGEVLMAGKPYRPIYELALEEARRARGKPFGLAQVLAIGDGPDTDIKGAADFGLAALLVADGITDGGAGLDVAEREVRARVPEARIVATLGSLDWP
ncbi:MAG: TIGR01459 family HAD-type hydrolase [Rhizobiales bacterium]|nr:TIGR01459 family HAD-type hydrolase [Hyphomicrobiales bacterium]